jgi:hypothetical protein
VEQPHKSEASAPVIKIRMSSVICNVILFSKNDVVNGNSRRRTPTVEMMMFADAQRKTALMVNLGRWY